MKKKHMRLYIILIVGFILLLLFIRLFMETPLFELFYLFHIIILVTIIVCYILLCIKVIRNQDKKGMDIFKIRTLPPNSEIIAAALEQISSEKEIVEVENGVLLTTIAGTFLIKVVSGQGTLKGSLREKEWILHRRKIKNPFDQKVDYYYLIYNQNIAYQVPDIEKVTLSELVFKIENKILNIKEKK